MGKIILKNNGLETQLINGEDFTTITPQSNTYFLGVDSITGVYEKLNPDGSIIDFEAGGSGGGTFTGGTVPGETTFTNGLFANVISAATYLNLPSTGGGVVEVTYSELVSKIGAAQLVPGTFYIITDFQTCYDQPDFDSSFNPIVGSNYKQGPIEPLMVLALSDIEINNKAYSYFYPNDSIMYDWTWDETEITANPALGRITERIDEDGNRTDYDHRNILFKRYLESTGGTNYNVVYDNGLGYVEVPTFSGTYKNNFIGDYTKTANFILSNNVFGVDCSDNKIGVMSYNNTIGDDSNNNTVGDFFIGNTIGNDFVSNEIGNYCGNSGTYTGTPVQNIFASNFKYNKIGDYFGNDLNFPTDGAGSGADGGNVVGSNFQNNVIGNNSIMNLIGTNFTGNKVGDYFSLNSFGSDSQDNNIGNYFIGNGGSGGYPNQMENNFVSNEIGNYITYNEINIFNNNKIGNYFTENILNSNFYNNLIGDNFEYNLIGSNTACGSFYRNDIGNSFNNNVIGCENLQNNEIGNQFNNNIIGGEVVKNTIGHGFNNNTIFRLDSNKIGNGFNDNVIQYTISNSEFGDYFSNNYVSDSYNNKIANNFQNNVFGDGFSFYDLGDVTSRNYQTFRNSLQGNIGYFIIGRQLIMHDTVSNEYYKFVFSKWTQGGNGGGFKYTRQKVYPSFDPSVEFERPDYSASTIDVIVPGVLEIKRDDNGGGIYNSAVEGSFNGSVSPQGTEWNSYFSSSNRGDDFRYNIIGDEFYSNLIPGKAFEYNNITSYFNNNNNIQDNFRRNNIKCELSSYNFSSATYVYAQYNCEIFQNASLDERLSYYDGSDVLNVHNITD